MTDVATVVSCRCPACPPLFKSLCPVPMDLITFCWCPACLPRVCVYGMDSCTSLTVLTWKISPWSHVWLVVGVDTVVVVVVVVICIVNNDLFTYSACLYLSILCSALVYPLSACPTLKIRFLLTDLSPFECFLPLFIVLSDSSLHFLLSLCFSFIFSLFSFPPLFLTHYFLSSTLFTCPLSSLLSSPPFSPLLFPTSSVLPPFFSSVFSLLSSPVISFFLSSPLYRSWTVVFGVYVTPDL